MKEITGQLYCSFCGGECFFRYRMGEYNIWQCQKCKTGSVWLKPSLEVLKKYYDGFLPHLDVKRIVVVKSAAKNLFPHLGICSAGNLKMLDIGGGGGFFGKAFEDLGYGECTYVDLDVKSCRFARNSLRLKRVFNCDAMNIKEHINQKFDFIYCRHLIEHLPDPTAFLKKIMSYLNDHGIFVVQFPNGNSLEYLAYSNPGITRRFVQVRETNNYSKLRVYWIMISGGMLHGLDPPRHLWAITEAGIKKWADDKKVMCHVKAYHLGDPAYSPYYKKGKTLKGKVREFLGQRILSSVYGGTHLVAVLQQKPSPKIEKC